MLMDKIASDKISDIQDINYKITKLQRERDDLIHNFCKFHGIAYSDFAIVYNNLKWK